MKFSEIIKELATTGPENAKRLFALAEKLPSDETLKGLNATLNNLIPYIPQMERTFGDGNVKNLERLLKRIPDQKTLDKLVAALPLLERLPDKATLSQLLKKADSLQGFLDEIEKT